MNSKICFRLLVKREKKCSLVRITVKWDYRNKVVLVINYTVKELGTLENSLGVESETYQVE